MNDTLIRDLRQAISTLTGLVEDLIAAQSFAPPAKPNNQKKLGKRDVTSIRDLKRIGITNKDIADIFDVNPATISRIVRKVYHR